MKKVTAKHVLITNGQKGFNQMIASHFEKKGYRCLLLFDEREALEKFEAEQPFSQALYISNMQESLLQAKLDEILQECTIDILVHGNEMLNEEVVFEKDPLRLEEIIINNLNRIYLVNKVVVNKMVMLKRGKIIYPLLFDTLYYAGYPSSPILNQAKLSLMKCMSRELGAFRLNVNAMTIGYYDNEFEKSEKKAVKNQVEIFSLKPKLPKLEDYIPALDMLVEDPAYLIGGENLHVGAGIETGI